MRTQRIHNLGPNSRESSPHQVIVVDTETRWAETDDAELHTLRVWDAATARRHGKHPSRPRVEYAAGETGEQLADWIESQVKTDPVAWLYTHNLSFDLSVSRLTVLLGERGWVVGANNLASDTPWAIMKKGNRTLRIADSWSLMPVPLATISEKVGVRKPPLPAGDDSDEAWHVRGRADVEITLAALLQLMDWWDQHKLGHWSITGARTGYNAMRHRCVKREGYDPGALQVGDGRPMLQHGDGHVVIDPDDQARKFERDTLYQGRRDAWRIGHQPRGVYVELDMQRAHLTVARTRKLPCRRGVRFTHLEIDTPYLESENMSVIADCRIRTDSARYPVRTKYGIIHPVGEFWTTLAGPELAEARRRGELLEIGAGYYYRLSWHMQPWAIWAEEVLQNKGSDHPPAAVLAVKGWSRSVPGIWAAKTSRVIEEGSSPVTGWHAEHAYDLDRKAQTTIVHMQGRMQVLLRDIEADDSFPAVLSFIQSHVRLALARMLERVPDYRIITCSTDSILIDSSGWAPLEAKRTHRAELVERGHTDAKQLAAYLTEAADPFTMTVKNVAADVRVLSPQHVRMDGKRKYSGVRADADEVERDKFRFMTWPKLGSQMTLEVPAGYLRTARTVDMTHLTVPRWIYECGCTHPAELRIAAGGGNVTAKPFEACPRHPEHVLAAEQHPALIRG